MEGTTGFPGEELPTVKEEERNELTNSEVKVVDGLTRRGLTEPTVSSSDDSSTEDSGSTDIQSEEDGLISPQLRRRLPTDLPHRVKEAGEEFVHKVMEEAEVIVHKVWKVVHHSRLPDWLKDNEYLVKGHRPELRSFKQCFKSIFRIHSETGNIWTHLLGMMMFLGITGYFLSRPSLEVQWQDKVVFACFFAGAIICLGMSWIFHTVFCHSRRVGKLFNKFDYCGITFLTVGSFIPWLYYGFYCRLVAKIAYLSLILLLGFGCIVVSLWDKFSDRRFRSIRAGMFVALGLSGVIPALHVVIVEGFWKAVTEVSLGWLSLMALLYILGAIVYAVRIPERLFPGKCDIWFQSHQIFHVLVVAAALVHYHGITTVANYRLTTGDCMDITREV